MKKSKSSPSVSVTTATSSEPPTAKSGTIARLTKTMSRLRTRHRRSVSSLPNIEEPEANGGPDSPTKLIIESKGYREEDNGIPAGGQKFIRLVEGMLAMESSISQLRKMLVASQAASDSLSNANKYLDYNKPITSTNASEAAKTDIFNLWKASEPGAKWQRYLDEFDSATVEHRSKEAITLLKKLEKFQTKANIADGLPTITKTLPSSATRSTAAAAGNSNNSNAGKRDEVALAQGQQRLAWQLQDDIQPRREKLAAGIARILHHPAAKSVEIAIGLGNLAAVSCSAAALEVLLERYTDQQQRELAALSPPIPSARSPAPELTAEHFAVSTAQILASNILEVNALANSVLSAGSVPELSAALVVWMSEQTVAACGVLSKHALVPCTVPAGLLPTCSCMRAFKVCCEALLPLQCSAVWPVALRQLWPAVEKTLQRRFRQVAEGLQKAAQTEISRAITNAADLPTAEGTPWSVLTEIIPCADRLLQELESIAAAVEPLASPVTTAALRQGIGVAFSGLCLGMQQALLPHLRGSGSTANPKTQASAQAAAELAMEVGSRLAERAIPDVLNDKGNRYGVCYNVGGLIEEMNRLAAALGMMAVQHS